MLQPLSSLLPVFSVDTASSYHGKSMHDSASLDFLGRERFVFFASGIGVTYLLLWCRFFLSGVSPATDAIPHFLFVFFFFFFFFFFLYSLLLLFLSLLFFVVFLPRDPSSHAQMI